MVGQAESEPITMPTTGPPLVPSAVTRSLALVAQVAPEPRGRVPGPTPYVVEVGAVGGDVPDLASGLDVLAVQVDLQPGVPREDVRVAAVQVLGERTVVAAEDVHHHRPRLTGLGGAQRQVEHGAQVVLVLAGDRTVHAPVAGVVRPHGQ